MFIFLNEKNLIYLLDYHVCIFESWFECVNCDIGMDLLEIK